MNSQTAILTPAQLTHFADFLDDSIKRLRGKGRQMRESVTAARAVWKDAKYDTFQKMGVEVYSVSTDTHFTHKAWHDASETIKKIHYPMLADPTGFLSRSFGVHIEEAGLAYRGTFLVDPEGKIKLAEIQDNGIGRNADELLRKTQAAQFIASHPNEVCPAKWTPGAKTLKPGLDLVGKI